MPPRSYRGAARGPATWAQREEVGDEHAEATVHGGVEVRRRRAHPRLAEEVLALDGEDELPGPAGVEIDRHSRWSRRGSSCCQTTMTPQSRRCRLRRPR
jgi:hypothetical protein